MRVSFGAVPNSVKRKNTVAKPAPTTASTNATSGAPSHAHTNAKKKLYDPKMNTAGLATVFFLLTLFGTDPKDTRIHRSPPPWAALIGLPLLGFLLLYAASDLPKLGDPASPASVHISPVYLENSLQDTNTPNVVTTVLMDYRSLDTLIETVVIFTAGIACALLLRRNKA